MNRLLIIAALLLLAVAGAYSLLGERRATDGRVASKRSKRSMLGSPP